MTGSFQFENTGQAPWQVLGDGIDQSSYLSYGNGNFFRVSIGSYIWETSGLFITVRNDSANLGDDLLSIGFDSGLTAVDPAFPPATSFPGIPTGLPNSGFGISMFDTLAPLDLVSSQGLPGSASDINLDSINYFNGGIFGSADGAGSFYSINFNLNSVTMRDVPTAVPEPGTLPLMGSMLLGAWLLTRRRLKRGSTLTAF